MILSCCCSKSRKDEDSTIEGPESNIKNINRILLEFVNEESKIGLKEVPCIAMIEKVLLASNKGEVPKKEIIQIYKTTDKVNQNSIKNYLIQDFFFVDNTRQKYDFNKIVLFNLLYSGGKDIEKANFLFNIIENSQSSAVHNHSQKLISTLENITYISTIAVGEILNSVRRFSSDSDDQNFQELLSLFSTNGNMLREFSNHISSLFLFPSTSLDEKQYLQRPEFLKRMEECVYLLIKPNEVRKKYTEYVWQNKARALLPSKLMRRTNTQRDYTGNSQINNNNTSNNLNNVSGYNEESKHNMSDFSEQSDHYNNFGNNINRQSQRGTFNRQSQGAPQATSKRHSKAGVHDNYNEYNNNKSQRTDQQNYRQEKIDRFAPVQQQQQQPSPFHQANNSGALRRQGSDISLAIYRYEDKSNRDSNNSPQSRPNKYNNPQSQNQNYQSQSANKYQHPQSSAKNNQDQQQYNNMQQYVNQNSSKNSRKNSHNNSKSLAPPQSSRNDPYQNQPAQQQQFSTSRGHSPQLMSPKMEFELDKEEPLLTKMGAQIVPKSNPALSKSIGNINNVNSNRESSDTQTSLLSTKNLQKYQNVNSYLKEMFGEQFVNLVTEIQEPFDVKRQQQLQVKLNTIKNQTKLEFPDYNNYPYHVREIFEYFNAIIHKEDLLEFSKGKLFRENIINVYLKILEKINLVRQSQYNFQRATMRNSIDLYSQTANSQTPVKLLYFNTNFTRKLNNEQSLKDCLNQLQNFFKYDQVVLPFFIDEEDDQRALIVSIKTTNFQVDLYDREREHDNHDISDTVLHLMDLSSRLQDAEFSEDQIDGGVEGVCVERDEDMIVAMCFIAESITFNRLVDLETFNLNLERQRVLDVFLTLLQFQ